MKIFGKQIFGEQPEPEPTLRESVEAHKKELEREQINLELDRIDTLVRSHAIQLKIEYLGKFLADRSMDEDVRKVIVRGLSGVGKPNQ